MVTGRSIGTEGKLGFFFLPVGGAEIRAETGNRNKSGIKMKQEARIRQELGLKQEAEAVQKVEEGQQEGWAIKLRVQSQRSTPSNWAPYPKDQRPIPSN